MVVGTKDHGKGITKVDHGKGITKVFGLNFP